MLDVVGVVETIVAIAAGSAIGLFLTLAWARRQNPKGRRSGRDGRWNT